MRWIGRTWAALPGLLCGAASAFCYAGYRADLWNLRATSDTDPDYKRLRVAIDLGLLEARVLGAVAVLWLAGWALACALKARAPSRAGPPWP